MQYLNEKRCLEDLKKTLNAVFTEEIVVQNGELKEDVIEEVEETPVEEVVDETKTGLPLADTHYAVSKEGKKCFVYIYETEGTLVLLLRLTDEYAESFRAAGKKIMRSAFPKSKDAWYSIIADDTYSETDIQEILTDACNMAKQTGFS